MHCGRRWPVLSKGRSIAAMAAALVFAAAQPISAQQTAEGAAAPFDPTPFLTAMVEYRLLAFSCEDVLPGSPLEGSEQIAQYFVDLGQEAPVGSDEQMDRLVYVLIRSQAASICSERLLDAALQYGEQAVIYEDAKPDSWPLAPSINAGPWCATESCSNLR